MARVRFDDSLATVLAADASTGLGAQAAWRQLVDLAGRGRIAIDADVIARLGSLREVVPQSVRAASARALAFARPDAALVGFFAEDVLPVAAPVLRTATLADADWLTLLPRLGPPARAVLRGRRDLSDAVVRGLEALGAVDFTLTDASPRAANDVAPPVTEAPASPFVEPDLPDAPLSPSPFVALADVARGLPVVAAALREVDLPELDVAAPAPSRFEIADIVARIDAFQRDREPTPVAVAAPRDAFRFATDATGTVRWVEGVSRAALAGLSLASARPQGLAQVDGGVAGAVRRRQRFADARLEVGGQSDAAGSWRIAGVPDFDPATGRFTGYRGSARRPARHERAEAVGKAGSDQLRQLVHELRTPANAVSGFAEMIEAQLLGPVADPYRARAGAIRGQAETLLAAIEDLDTAARIEGGALDLRPDAVAMAPLIDRIVGELQPLARSRGAVLAPGGERVTVLADPRAAERLVARLLAALVAVAGEGERVGIAVARRGAEAVLSFTRPRALGTGGEDALFAFDEQMEDGPALGIGFTLRLVRNLAAELGGALAIDGDVLTLRLPLALDRPVERTHAS